jgi:hypothetical protein
MRHRTRSFLIPLLIAALTIATAAPALARGGDVPDPDEVCDLLTNKQVKTIMGAKPVGGPITADEGCSWETDPLDRANYRYVVLEVIPLADAIEGYPDYGTALDEGTTTLVTPVEGLGDEAYSTKSVLIAEGTIDGLNAVTGDVVVELSWQTSKPVEVDSSRYDKVVKILDGVLDEV